LATGAAWKHLVDSGRSLQELFAYIEDADLWRWRLPDSRCFHAAFGALGLELDANANPAIFDQLLQLLPAELIARVKPALLVVAAADLTHPVYDVPIK
jgi:hypothetical protein